MSYEKPETIRDKKYLSWIRTLPCIICGNTETVAHHESISGRGTGIKASDFETIPLCHFCHNELHSTGKLTFSKKYNIEYAKEIKRLNNLYKKIS